MIASEEIHEKARVEALHTLDILDTPQEHEFDELVCLAAEICCTPISLFTLVDSDRQWFKASVGVTARQTPRSISFCSHAIESPELLVVENTALDPRFEHNSLVTGAPGIRFYAGMPIQSPDGFSIGTLCVLDTVPRTLSQSQRNALTILSRQVKARLELRAKQQSLELALEQNNHLYTELRDRNSIFLAFMNNGPFVSYIKDPDGRMIFYNEKMAKRFGITTEQWIGRLDREIWPPAMAETFRNNDLAILQGGKPVELAEASPGPDGSVSHWKSYKFPFKNESGNLMLAGMSIDDTEELVRKTELEKALREKVELAGRLEDSNILFQTFVNANPNICYFKSEEGCYLSYNQKFAEFFDIDLHAWIGKSDRDVQPPEVADECEAHDSAVRASGAVSEFSRSLPCPNGDMVSLKSIKFLIKMADGRIILAGVAIDVTREVEKERALSLANAQLEQLATTDALTGLCNRRIFEERAAAEFAKASCKECPLSLIILDIDDFKKRNDTYGHAAGDDALRALAQVLTDGIRTGDVAARIGGEEFGILLPESDTAGSLLVATRIQSLLREADCGPGELTISMGIASRTAATASWEALASQADDAMYEAKRSGKNRFVVSSKSV